MKNQQEDDFVGNCADCVHEFNWKNSKGTWKDPRGALSFLGLFLEFCKAHGQSPEVANEFIAGVMAQCEQRGIDLPQGMTILNEEEWDDRDSEKMYLSPKVQKRLIELGLSVEDVICKVLVQPAQ